MTIAKALHDAATCEVEAAGLHWRVRKINSADVAKVGLATLRMMTPESLRQALPTPAGSGEGDPSVEDQAVAELQRLQRVAAMLGEKDIEKRTQLRDACVCAGLIAASTDGETWEPIRVVLNERDVELDDNVLHVSHLPAGVAEELYTAIDSLDKDKGAAMERLRSFLGESGDPRSA